MIKKIINTCLLVGVVSFLSFSHPKDGFKAEQLKSAKVKEAYRKYWPGLQKALSAKQLAAGNFDIYLRVFKNESVLEVWLKNKDDKQFQLFKSVPVCAKSGTLGPKRRQGDGQVPEGFYEITAFNPYSTYHVALKVGYPNKSDAIKANGPPGGDIMIHGYCVTIGCIPLQNEPVEELYVLCVEARNRGRLIRTDIYPYKFGDKNAEALTKNYDAETIRFWSSLKQAWVYFEQNHALPKIATDKAGNYSLAST